MYATAHAVTTIFTTVNFGVKAVIDPGPFRESVTRHLIGLEHLLRHRLSVLGHQIVSQTQFGIHFKKL
jgi:hypothetical protein